MESVQQYQQVNNQLKEKETVIKESQTKIN